jgi:hypothetical protein
MAEQLVMNQIYNESSMGLFWRWIWICKITTLIRHWSICFLIYRHETRPHPLQFIKTYRKNCCTIQPVFMEHIPDINWCISIVLTLIKLSEARDAKETSIQPRHHTLMQ